MTGLVLGESRRLRHIYFGALYGAQGISDAMVLIIFPAYLASNGASASAVGSFLAIAMLPNAAKLAIGPVVDRFALAPMGCRKPWLLLGQLGISASLAVLALLGDPANHVGAFTAGAFAITLSTAFQDVATDATAMDLVPAAELGRTNSIMWGAKTLGTAAVASTGAALLRSSGFAAKAATAAAAALAAAAMTAFVRERRGDRLLPWTSGGPSPEPPRRSAAPFFGIVRLLAASMRSGGVLRLTMVSIIIGLLVGSIGALAPVMMIENFAWAQADYAELRSALKLASGVAGMIAGGFFIERLGHRAMLIGTLSGIALACAALALALTSAAAAAFLTLYEMLLVFAFITFFAATARISAGAIAATQFSFVMVCGNLAMVGGAALLGPLLALGGIFLMLVAAGMIALSGALVVAVGAGRAERPVADGGENHA